MTTPITTDMPVEEAFSLGHDAFREWQRQKADQQGRWIITWYDQGEYKRLWLNEVKDAQEVVSELEHEYGVQMLRITDILHTHDADKTYLATDFWRAHPAQSKE